VQEQPPPMVPLCMADNIFKVLRDHGLGRTIIAESDEEDEDDEAENDDDGIAQAGERNILGSAADADVAAPSGAAAESRTPVESTGSSRLSVAAEGDSSDAAENAAVGAASRSCAPSSSVPAKRTTAAGKRRAGSRELKEHREIGIDEDPLVALVREAEEDSQRLQWPRRPNFRSVLAIGYRDTDSFRWHTDLAGEEGWVCSISVGAKAVFEYLPTAAPSALRRARAKAAEDCVRVEINSGDAVLFNGGLLPHRVASVDTDGGEGMSSNMRAMMAPYARLNLQVRVYGAGESYGLQELLGRGYDYVH